LHHAGHDVVRNGGGGQARAAIVEQADDVAIGDAALRRIDGLRRTASRPAIFLDWL
jgi:hypothetical protein